MHTHQELVEKLPPAKMPSLIINCGEIKSEVSKKERKTPLGCRILYFIMLVWKGAAGIYQSEAACLVLGSSAPRSWPNVLRKTFHVRLWLTPWSWETLLEKQKNPKPKQLACVSDILDH